MAKLKEAYEELEENRIQGVRQKISEGYELIKQRHKHKISRFVRSRVKSWWWICEKSYYIGPQRWKKRMSKAQTRAERKDKDERVKRRMDPREESKTNLSINNTSSKANTSPLRRPVYGDRGSATDVIGEDTGEMTVPR